MITVFVFTNRTRASTKRKVAARKMAKKAAAVEKNPLVRFFYPQSKTPWNSQERFVRMISATNKYVTGLEITSTPEGKQAYAFKKFLAAKIKGMTVLEFNPSVMS